MVVEDASKLSGAFRFCFHRGLVLPMTPSTDSMVRRLQKHLQCSNVINGTRHECT